MTGNYHKLPVDLINIDAHTKFGLIMSIRSQDIERKQNSDLKSLRKMTGNNPKLDLVNDDVHTKFGWTLSIRSQDIERKRYSEVNQGP